MISPRNLRILLVDDMPSIHEDFRKILAPPAVTTRYCRGRCAKPRMRA